MCARRPLPLPACSYRQYARCVCTVAHLHLVLFSMSASGGLQPGSGSGSLCLHPCLLNISVPCSPILLTACWTSHLLLSFLCALDDVDRTIRSPARKPVPQISDRSQARLQRQRMLELQQEAADLEALKMTPARLLEGHTMAPGSLLTLAPFRSSSKSFKIPSQTSRLSSLTLTGCHGIRPKHARLYATG